MSNEQTPQVAVQECCVGGRDPPWSSQVKSCQVKRCWKAVQPGPQGGAGGRGGAGGVMWSRGGGARPTFGSRKKELSSVQNLLRSHGWMTGGHGAGTGEGPGGASGRWTWIPGSSESPRGSAGVGKHRFLELCPRPTEWESPALYQNLRVWESSSGF